MSNSIVSRQAPTEQNPTGIDTAALLEAATSSAEILGKSMTDVMAVTQRQGAAGAARERAILDKAAAESDVLFFEQTNKLANQKKAQEAAAWFGVNQDASGFILAELADKLKSDILDNRQRAEAIKQKRDVGFLDNPLDWIINQITIPFDEQALNASKEMMQNTAKEMQLLEQTADKTIALQNSLNTGESLEKLAAAQKAVAATAAANVANSQIELSNYQLNGISVRTNMTRSQFEVVKAANDALVQQDQLRLAMSADRRAEVQLELSMEQLGITKENLEFARRNLAISERADERAALQLAISTRMKELQEEALLGSTDGRRVLQQQLNTYAEITNTVPLSVEQFSKNLSVQRREAMFERMSDPSFLGERRLGATPARALRSFSDFNDPLTPAQRDVANALTGIQASVIQTYGPTSVKGTWDRLGKEAQIVEVDKAIKAELDKQRAIIPESGSIYSPPSAQAVFGNPANPQDGSIKPALQGAPTIAEGLLIQRSNARTPLRADNVMAVALDAIMNKGKSVEQMGAEISTMYQAIQIDLNANRQFGKFAIPGLSQQDGFRQLVGSYNPRALDLSNQAAVTNYLARQYAMMVRDQAAANQFGGQTPQ